uniref:Putative acetyltransferase n=1 Tax=Noccaea caerulescens TaxID=107243 RepID=A0A1J3D978_NOCCA
MANDVVISETIVRPESYVDGSDRIGLRYISLHGISSSFKPNTHKEVLSLKIFYPFAGRLAKNENEDDETVSFFVDCDGSGVKFVHASATTISVSDVLEPADGTVPDFLTGFIPGNGVRSCDGISESLIAFQVTELKDGVLIGYGSNHMIADGFSFWSLVGDLLYRVSP